MSGFIKWVEFDGISMVFLLHPKKRTLFHIIFMNIVGYGSKIPCTQKTLLVKGKIDPSTDLVPGWVASPFDPLCQLAKWVNANGWVRDLATLEVVSMLTS